MSKYSQYEKGKTMNMTTKILFMTLFILIYTSQSLAQWNLLFHDNNSTVNCITANESTTICAGFDMEGIFYSYNDGLDWSEGNTGLTNHQVRALTLAVYKVNPGVTGSVILAGTWGNGVFRSTGPWDNPNTGLSNLYISALYGNGDFENYTVLAGTWGGGVFISNDGGCNWIEVNSGITNLYVRSLLINGGNYFAGTLGGLFHSTNSGSEWHLANQGINNPAITALARGGIYLYAGTSGGGIFRSSDNGANWFDANTGLGNLNISALAVSMLSNDEKVFAATWGGGVYYSTNNGEQWIAENEGMTGNLVRSLLVFNNYLFAGNDDGSIWARPLSDFTTTAVNSTVKYIMPQQFELSQNYPNPFNPITSISFSLPSRFYTTLKIFDVIGREVAVIVSEELSAGSYTRRWNAAQMPSGVFFYRLQVGAYTETKKLILLK
jgi:hypothetical protein